MPITRFVPFTIGIAQSASPLREFVRLERPLKVGQETEPPVPKPWGVCLLPEQQIAHFYSALPYAVREVTLIASPLPDIDDSALLE